MNSKCFNPGLPHLHSMHLWITYVFCHAAGDGATDKNVHGSLDGEGKENAADRSNLLEGGHQIANLKASAIRAVNGVPEANAQAESDFVGDEDAELLALL